MATAVCQCDLALRARKAPAAEKEINLLSSDVFSGVKMIKNALADPDGGACILVTMHYSVRCGHRGLRPMPIVARLCLCLSRSPSWAR